MRKVQSASERKDFTVYCRLFFAKMKVILVDRLISIVNEV